jgi:hypothetical protein
MSESSARVNLPPVFSAIFLAATKELPVPEK